MKASELFLQGEGDRWFQRNSSEIRGERLRAIGMQMTRIWERLPKIPNTILEVGCADGMRLNAIGSLYPHVYKGRVELHGVDPSAEAIAKGREEDPALHLLQGTADNLPYIDGKFDCVIFGFCLYLCDKNDLFSIAQEADRVLQDNGVLIIYDFDPPFSYSNTYVHRPELLSHKMCYRNMFLWHPNYTLMEVISLSHKGNVFDIHPDERVSFSLLYKNSQNNHTLINPYA